MKTGAIIAGLAFFFYRSVWAMLPMFPIGWFWFVKEKQRKIQRQQEELESQFAECILAVGTLLRAGLSLENAFLECEQDMELMFGKESSIVEELLFIRRGLHINISLEELLVDLGERSNSEDIYGFAEVFSIAKRSGGNMTDIIGSTAEIMEKRQDIAKERKALLGGRRMELFIMECMPFAMVFYLGVANKGYFDPLYHNLTGVMVMTGCFGMYAAAYALGSRILAEAERM